MKLQSLSAIENSRVKFRAEFDDGTHLTVTANQIADYNLYSGRELTEDEYVQMKKSLELGTAKARALRILGNRNISARDLEARLEQKGVHDETARETVEWLEEMGLVNDSEYAAMIVSHYTKKGYGIARIRDEFYKRKIPRELWDEALENLGQMEDSAYEFLMKKLRGGSGGDEIRRAESALYRRGFRRDEIRAAVSRYLENIDEAGDFPV